MRARIFGMAALVAGLMLPTAAKASQINFSYTTAFSNSTLPGGPAPWMNVNINDATAAGSNDVRITISMFGLTNQEFISGVYLSLDPVKYPSALTAFSLTTLANPNSAFSTLQSGPNCCQADGDGKYDLLFNFNTANATRATDNTVYMFDLKNLGAGGKLLAQDFDFLAAPGGGNGPFYAAAHLQGIGPQGNDSTWIADSTHPTGDCPGCTINPVDSNPVPEPMSMMLFGTGMVGVAQAIRKRRKTQ